MDSIALSETLELFGIFHFVKTVLQTIPRCYHKNIIKIQSNFQTASSSEVQLTIIGKMKNDIEIIKQKAGFEELE